MPMLESNLDQSGFSARFSHVISSYFHSNCAAVGRGGYNRREDVICIQTALANAKISGHGSFWTGKIDGKMSPDMMGAITLFQRAVHAPAVGRIGTNCPTSQSLEKVLPAAFKGMVAEKSNAAHHKPKPASGAGHSSRAPRRRLKAALIRDQFLKNLVLPLALRNELTAFRGAVDRELDLYLSYTSVKTDPAGYLRFELDIDPEPSTMDMVDIRRMIHTFRGIRAIPGSLLVLTTAQPIRFRPGSLRPGGAMHHMLSGKVNKNSGPVHDVAAIQAALANIKRPGGGAPFCSSGDTVLNSRFSRELWFIWGLMREHRACVPRVVLKGVHAPRRLASH